MKSSHSNARQLLSPPPLYVWAAAALAFAAIFLLSIKAYMDYNYEKPFIEDSILRIESLRARTDAGNNGVRVVAIGSSLMRRAVLYDGKMETFAQENGLEGLEFVRITRPNGDIEDYAPFIDKLVDARPDVILIEADTFFYFRREKGFLKEYPDFLRYVLLKSLNASKLKLPKDEADLDRADDPPLNELDADGRTTVLEKTKDRKPSKEEITGEFLRKTSAGGITIVLVDLQREPGFERLAGLNRPEMIRFAASLPEEYGVTLISYPGELGKEFFWDHAHLNEEGRTRFSRWLVDVLKGMDKRA